MPEIAEVRTVARTLKEKIVGKKINKIDFIYDKIINEDLNCFSEHVLNKTIEDIKTVGKYLIFNLGEYSLVSHLRMEGKYFIKPINEEIVKHEHIIFYLDDISLRYHDIGREHSGLGSIGRKNDCIDGAASAKGLRRKRRAQGRVLPPAGRPAHGTGGRERLRNNDASSHPLRP